MAMAERVVCWSFIFCCVQEVPGIASHVLSDFYNNTRSEYYRQLENARKKNDLSDFINYAVDGFYDGLMENLKTIQEKQIQVFWSNFIYEKFAGIQFTKRSAFTRKRDLILEFPLNREFSVDEIPLLTPSCCQKLRNFEKGDSITRFKRISFLGSFGEAWKKIQSKYRCPDNNAVIQLTRFLARDRRNAQRSVTPYCKNYSLTLNGATLGRR